MSEAIYDPDKARIERIVQSSKFKQRVFELHREMPNESNNSLARWAFIQHMGWDSSFFGLGGMTYEERFIMPRRSIPEKNAVSYAAAVYEGEQALHVGQPLGPDIFTDLVPDFAGGAIEGALEGVENVLTVVKWVAIGAAVVYVAPKALELVQTAKELKTANA